jgi:hypothetical protein
MPIEFGHRDDDACDHRVQIRIDSEQIAAIVDELGELLVFVEVESANHAGQNQAQAEGIGERVVMLEELIDCVLVASGEPTRRAPRENR